MDAVTEIADAVLYEGYVLWPYRRSAIKNRQRWTFGGVYPRGWSEPRDDDPWTMQTQCLVEADSAGRVAVEVRFLHVVERGVGRARNGGLELVDELVVGDQRHLAWDEAVERRVVAPERALGELEDGLTVAIDFPGGTTQEELHDRDGRRAGALVRSWEPLEGSLQVGAEPFGPRLFRLRARIANLSAWPGGARERALRRTFCSTHTVIRARGGAQLVSMTDPPEPLCAAAAQCANEGTWPVLVGAEGERHTILSSPIILSDHPQVAPESPGDLFDGGEIDGLLTLSILSLTDAEKAEVRATDPRARAVLDRTEALTEQELMRLHGTMRDFRAPRG
jgi:hypothetical protein